MGDGSAQGFKKQPGHGRSEKTSDYAVRRYEHSRASGRCSQRFKQTDLALTRLSQEAERSDGDRGEGHDDEKSESGSAQENEHAGARLALRRLSTDGLCRSDPALSQRLRVDADVGHPILRGWQDGFVDCTDHVLGEGTSQDRVACEVLG